MSKSPSKSIVFVSNYFNHHQSALSDAFYKITNGNYYFIQTVPMEEERKNMGWGGISLPAYVKSTYTSEQSYCECVDLINTADVVIIGSAPNALIEDRIKNGKLVFRYSERILKKGLELYKFPIRWYRFHKANPKNSNIYMLCASAYTAGDFAKFGLFKNKTYKWGYFPAIKRYDDIEKIINSKRPASLLWVARFLGWKHPEAPLYVAKRLKDEGYNFTLNIIGSGELEQKIRQNVAKIGLETCVKLLGTMSPEKVREHMEQSEIFLFTSDKNEGWGAVLNESMNSACAVVASRAIGSVPYLIKDGENGLVYKDGNLKDLYNKVKYLLDNKEKRRGIGINAYKTLTDTWNADVAAERLLKISEKLCDRDSALDFYKDGLCSKG